MLHSYATDILQAIDDKPALLVSKGVTDRPRPRPGNDVRQTLAVSVDSKRNRSETRPTCSLVIRETVPLTTRRRRRRQGG